MNARLAFTRITLLLVVLGMAGLAGLGYVLQRSDLKTLQDLSKENIMWSSAQLEIELHRFLGALGRMAFTAACSRTGFSGAGASKISSSRSLYSWATWWLEICSGVVSS